MKTDALQTSIRGLFLGHQAHRDLMVEEKPFWRPFQAIYRVFILAGALIGAVTGAAIFVLIMAAIGFALFYPFGLLIIGILTRMGV
ncbi:MAG: hypothetical protein CO125_04625 [Hydrogenophilales bacterium CG_4_9_14_3_um_filter_59_35]|nr:MAG: hypothetical protein COW70_15030 [Hydrogenophilales bacterium CG18_big_fil_WC_8_21_14_2_50_58_12]PIY00981.1 MAG: hypothetical protein COZ23_05690 [Hydrogenophilales bacterium CG_4_10_14_3_um_filter_58_23]PJB07571.1 MAG: hypothetical protein CO125_04625 [Hydrogenophilales bacterium CG_4_9_14_3_um_filter_59_35]